MEVFFFPYIHLGDQQDFAVALENKLEIIGWSKWEWVGIDGSGWEWVRTRFSTVCFVVLFTVLIIQVFKYEKILY